LNFIDNLQPKPPYPKFQEICPVNAVYFDANRQPPSHHDEAGSRSSQGFANAPKHKPTSWKPSHLPKTLPSHW